MVTESFFSISLDAWRFYFQAIQFVGTILLGVYVWLSNRHRVTVDKIEAVKAENSKGLEKARTRMDGHDTRLTCIETEIRALPKGTDIAALSNRLAVQNALLKYLAGRLKGIGRAVDLINEHLINKEPK
jgi:hypothetical protein